MGATGASDSATGENRGKNREKNHTAVDRKSERELVITRRFDAPARLVFEAWTTPELLTRWWAPKSAGMSLLSCEVDARSGGRYRFEFGQEPAKAPEPSKTHEPSKTMAFFGQYLEVTPYSRLVWTNEESTDGAVSTVTFEETDGMTLLVLHERYPSKEALDAAIAGMEDGMPEQFEQLDELLVTLAGRARRS
jgi:uncharacterized protein YndB with AHSA1/START domain